MLQDELRKHWKPLGPNLAALPRARGYVTARYVYLFSAFIHPNTALQKIRSSSYYSLNVLGISIIICVGALILLAGSFTKDLFDLISRISGLDRHTRLKYARIECEANSTLQLQHLAYETAGSGIWSGGTDAIPVTREACQLARLDISDPKHPYLIADRDIILVDLDDRSSSRRGSLRRKKSWNKQCIRRQSGVQAYLHERLNPMIVNPQANYSPIERID